MDKRIPVYECKIENTDDTGIFAISFVDDPANESSFVALSKKPAPLKLAIDKQKQILTGVVLIPDQLIYRYDEERGEYYIKFTAQDIEKISLKMMRTGIALHTTTHQHKDTLKGNFLTESWIVADPKKDKTVALGLGEFPKGTLVVSYKIENPTYWRNEVLTGNVKGFSLEGLFNYNNVKMSKKPKNVAPLTKEGATKSEKGNRLSTFFSSISLLLESDTEAAAEGVAEEAKKDETGSGEPFLIFTLSDGSEVWTDEEGFCTIDGEQAPAGEHALDDGNFIVIDDSGYLVLTSPEADTTQAEAPNVDLAKKRAKAFLKKYDPKAAEIAKLKKRLAELEAQPSAEKAEAPVEGGKATENLSSTDRMAAVLKNRRANELARKSKR